jgi:hypothetical protein
MKFVPAIMTNVPPLMGPLFGVTSETVGVATKVNWSPALVALVPPAEVTVTSTLPPPAVGETAVIDVSPFTVGVAAGVPPKLTPVALVNPVPVIVTVVPPLAGPTVGETPVTLGLGTNPGAKRR